MDLARYIRNIPDFPKPGIQFKDITTLLKDGRAFATAIDALAERLAGRGIELVAGPEARGFMIGAPLAVRLGVGFVPVRKAGKLPSDVLRGSYQLEYGHDSLEIHRDAIRPGQRVAVVDDLLATGGTISATLDLVRQLGADVVAAAFLIELTPLRGRERLAGLEVHTLIQFDDA